MNWNRVDLKTRGKAAFTRNYWKCVLVALILMLITSGGSRSSSSNTIRERWSHNADSININSSNGIITNIGLALSAVITTMVVILVVVIALVIGILLKTLLLNPLEVGCQRFFLDNAWSEQAHPRLLGFAFKSGYYGNVTVTMFLRDLYIFLWSLLLVIPGIVKSYEYRMIPYLLAENPGMNRDEAFQLSRQMMDGEKWNAFVLDLSFIGWHILSGFTFGLLDIFYVQPYQSATNTELFYALKRY